MWSDHIGRSRSRRLHEPVKAFLPDIFLPLPPLNRFLAVRYGVESLGLYINPISAQVPFRATTRAFLWY